MNPWRSAKYWHDRAAEARAIGDELTDKTAKKTMYSIANGYDDMAKRAATRHEGTTEGK